MNTFAIGIDDGEWTVIDRYELNQQQTYSRLKLSE